MISIIISSKRSVVLYLMLPSVIFDMANEEYGVIRAVWWEVSL